MEKKQKSLADVINQKGREILAEVKTNSLGDDLLDLLPSTEYDQNGSDSSWVNLGRKPNSAEIDCGRTSEEMILDEKAILKDGTKISWCESRR